MNYGSMSYKRAEALAKAFPNEVFEKIAKDSRKKGAYNRNDKYFEYIQLPPVTFIAGAIPWIKKRMHFVDIGCGAGDKLALVHMLAAKDVKITGIEMRKAMVEKARELCPFAHIIHKNALGLTYENYDILYAYRPIAD